MSSCDYRKKDDWIVKLADYCENTLDFKNASLSVEYYYQSLPLCIIDAVYSIGVKYEGTRNTVMRYCEYYGLPRIRQDKSSVPPADSQESIDNFAQKMKSTGVEYFAKAIFKNLQRTSSRQGILKSEAVLRFAECLQQNSVNFLQDIPKVIADDKFEKQIRAIPGQTSGISLSYFYMLSGSDDLIKPDRMILQFLENAIGQPCSVKCAQKLVSGACEILKRKYQHLSPRLLDNCIWKHQREVGKNSEGGEKREEKGKNKSDVTDLLCIGPFKQSEIIVCSADAGPNSQCSDRHEAEYLFPRAKWVRAVGNAARKSGCRFVILTTAHGAVNPTDLIKPYDLHVNGHERIVENLWRDTSQLLLKNKGYKIMVFYAGGCPRQAYEDIFVPILQELGISFLSFGRPNMFDVGKIEPVVNLLKKGASGNEIKAILKVPDRFVYYPVPENNKGCV
jgi:hypothetical protein